MVIAIVPDLTNCIIPYLFKFIYNSSISNLLPDFSKTKTYTTIFGNKDNRALKNAQKLVEVINSLESEFETLSDEELKSKTREFKEFISKGNSTFS